MASRLKLDYVGTQARNFGGQYLGLPVISLASSKSLPNILTPSALNPIHRDNSVATQVNVPELQTKIIYEDDFEDDHTPLIKVRSSKEGYSKVVILNRPRPEPEKIYHENQEHQSFHLDDSLDQTRRTPIYQRTQYMPSSALNDTPVKK